MRSEPVSSVDWRGSSKIAFSPDDRYIAYDLGVADSDAERHVYVMAIDGAGLPPRAPQRARMASTSAGPVAW